MLRDPENGQQVSVGWVLEWVLLPGVGRSLLGTPGLGLGFDFCVSGYFPNPLSFAIVGDQYVP